MLSVSTTLSTAGLPQSAAVAPDVAIARYRSHTLTMRPVAAAGDFVRETSLPDETVCLRSNPVRRARPEGIRQSADLSTGVERRPVGSRLAPRARPGAICIDGPSGSVTPTEASKQIFNAMLAMAMSPVKVRFSRLWDACALNTDMRLACARMFDAFPDKVMRSATGEGVFRTSLDRTAEVFRAFASPAVAAPSSGPASDPNPALLAKATLLEQSHFMKDLLQQVIGKVLGKLDDTADLGLCMQWTHVLDDYLRSEGGAHERSAVDGFSRLLAQLKHDGRGKAELTEQSMWTSSALIQPELQFQRAALSPALEQALTLRGALQLNVRPAG
ncbi:hypothetical protein THUN1379_27650 [Paludibacterium sp. THUN1379]|nr:hypothetical protein THUN1379_27650 [Paludibacterium sp. THUN1379]